MAKPFRVSVIENDGAVILNITTNEPIISVIVDMNTAIFDGALGHYCRDSLAISVDAEVMDAFRDAMLAALKKTKR